MSGTDQDTRHIHTKCDGCGFVDYFCTDNMTVRPGDSWEQECSRDDCYADSTVITAEEAERLEGSN